MSYNTPHFDLPLRFVGSTFATVEQDTLDDVVNCVIASMRTPLGWRAEQPTFGTSDLALDLQPLDLQRLVQQVTKDEPRAVIFLQQNPDLRDELIAKITASVSTREGT